MPDTGEQDRLYIESIVHEYYSYINNRDFSRLRSASYIAPVATGNFEYRLDGSSEDSLDNHVSLFEEHCKNHPDRRIHATEITTTFESAERASTFVNGTMSEGGVSIPGTTLLTLRKIRGEWKVTSASAMRGPGLDAARGAMEGPPKDPRQEDMSTTYLRKSFTHDKTKGPGAMEVEDAGPEATKALLMDYGRQFIELHNSTSITTLLDADWVAPYFSAGTANRTAADIDLQTYVQRQVQYLQKFPHFSTRLVNVQAELDSSCKTATVFVDTEQEGAPLGVKLPGIGILSWRRDELSGKWFFWKLVVMRGNTGAAT